MKRAAELRLTPTPAESKLWGYLRGNRINGVKFRRQHAIGNYVVDFCSIQKKLAIELDGTQHIDQAEYDASRTEFLRAQGYRVLRFGNGDVLNDVDGVVRTIQHALEVG